MSFEDGARTVFVISGDADVQVLCRGALPFPIAATGPGDDLLQELTASRPAVVLIDILEPTDWQVVGRLRDSPVTAQVPVVVLTAWPVDRTFRRCADQLGCSAILAKPCDPELLLQAVEEAFFTRSPSSKGRRARRSPNE